MRIEQNLNVRTGKSEADVTKRIIKDCVRGIIYIFIRQMAATINKSENKTNATNMWTASLTIGKL